jgi:hypothetical protein
MKHKVITVAALGIGLAGFRVLGGAEESSNHQTVAGEYMKGGDSRTFAIEYVGKVPAVPEATKRLRVWMPVPQDSTVQSIRRLSFSHPPRLTREAKYGNRIAYWEFETPKSDLDLTMKFVCERKEIVVDLNRLIRDGLDRPTLFTAFKQPDKLVTVDDEIRELSRKVTADKRGTLEKSRSLGVVVSGGVHDGKARQKTLQIQPQMTFSPPSACAPSALKAVDLGRPHSPWCGNWPEPLKKLGAASTARSSWPK